MSYDYYPTTTHQRLDICKLIVEYIPSEPIFSIGCFFLPCFGSPHSPGSLGFKKYMLRDLTLDQHSLYHNI